MVEATPRLLMFGGLTLESPAGQALTFPTRRAGRLLAMLVLGPHRGLGREVLIEALWPEADPRGGRHALATELWRLRQVLAAASLDGWIVEVSGRLGVAAEARASADATAFEAALAAARDFGAPLVREAAIAEAERLYAGEFMAGETDEWSLSRRAWYAAQHVDLMLISLDLARKREDWPEVMRIGNRLTLADPLLEAVQQDLMRAHLATGNAAAALAVFRRLEHALRVELEVAPSEETRRLRDLALPRGGAPALPAPDKPRPLLGIATLPQRLRELARDLDALSRRME